jgi:PAS domain S-box-containing protein
MPAPQWVESNLKRELGARGTAVEFSAAILNSVSAHIAVLDCDGVIVATNEAWRRFASENGLKEKRLDFGLGTNYLDVCRDAAERGIETATQSLHGILEVLDGSAESFSLEYPCHSPDARRWFSLTVTPITVRKFRGAVVLHNNITDRKLAEQERHESEHRLAGFIQHMPGLAWIKDDQGRYVEANEQTAQALGISLQSMRDRSDDQLIASESAAQFRADDLRVLTSCRPMQFEEAVDNGANGVRQYLVNKFPIPQGEGQPLMVGGVAVDITDRIAEEQGIRGVIDVIARTTGTELYRAIAVHLTRACEVDYAFVAQVDADHRTNAKVVAAANSGECFAGFELPLHNTAAETVMDETFLHVPAGARQRFPSDRLLSDRGAESLMGIVLSSAEGQPLGIIALLHQTPIADPRRAETYLRIVAARAAAELDRERAQAALRMNETRLQTFLDHAQDALFLYDDECRVLDVNQQACDVLGFTRDELLGAAPGKFNPDATELLVRWINERLKAGETVTFDSRHQRKDGTLFPVEVRIRPFWLEGRRFGLSIVRDLSEQKRSEAALEATQSRMTQMLEHANIGVWDWDIMTNQTILSRIWKSQLGYEESEISDQFEEWQSRLHPDDLEPTLAALEQTILRRSGILDLEFRMRHKNGSWRWIMSRGNFLPNPGGPAIQMAGVHLDITERKRIESALRGQLRVLELIATADDLSNVLRGIVAHVEEQLPEIVGSILLVNEEGTRLYLGAALNLPPQYSATIEGMPIKPNLGPCGAAAYLKKTIIVSDIATDPRWTEYRDMTRSFGLRACWSMPIFAGDQRRSGTTDAPVLGTIALYGREPAVPTQAQLEVISAAANLAGIAIERHKSGAAIRDSEDRLRTLLENLQHVAVQAYDPHGTISFWNKASERVYGFAAAEALGKDLIELLHPVELRPYERQLIADALREVDLPEPEEVEVVRRDGTKITIYTMRILHRRTGRAPEFFRFDVDVSDRKRAEQELALRQTELFHNARLSTLGQMIAALSHELAQPLTAIGNYASASIQIAESGSSTDQEKLCTYIGGIAQQSQRCIAILQRLRDFSRRTLPSRSSCDIRQLVEDSIELISTELMRRKVALHAVFDEPSPRIVADRIQIQQVIVNLLTNACDAVHSKPAAMRRVTIEATRQGKELRLEVADAGGGLSPEAAERLFEPFFTTKQDGMGIGLNICESIIRQHGGRLEARNNQQEGATFTVHLPLSEEE